MVDDAEGHRVSKEACSALVTVAPGRLPAAMFTAPVSQSQRVHGCRLIVSPWPVRRLHPGADAAPPLPAA